MRADDAPVARWVGRPLARVEDERLVTGRGRYVDDLAPAHCLHLAFARSPHAHARILALRADAALAAPGVAAVYTGADVAHIDPLPVDRHLPDMRLPRVGALARERVAAVGEPVAAVVARTGAEARDAAEQVEVDYEPLAAAVDAAGALAAGAPAVHAAGNLCFEHTWADGDVAGAFARAHRRVRVAVTQQRLAPTPLEPRATLADYDPGTGALTVWTSTQAPFRVRAHLAALLGLSEARVRVVAPDVGGAFGAKGALTREDLLVAFAAIRLARPVKWVATRSEDLATTHHGRGAAARGELAVAADGTLLALEATIECPLGAAPAFSAAVGPRNHARLLPGPYLLPAARVALRGVFTHTAPVGIYRGAGRPEAAFLMERLIDEAARALALDPAEIRRRNFVPRERFPHVTPTGLAYDSGDYARALDAALALAEYPRLRAEQAARRARGELVGIGLGAFVEPCGLGWESGVVRVERTGAVTAITGTSAQGQGHATAFAQIVADALGVGPEAVAVRAGDTAGAPQGFGAFASRSTALAGSALLEGAAQVRAKARRIAATLLEAAAEDVVPALGGFEIAGAPSRRVGWAEVAAAAYAVGDLRGGEPPGLEATAFFHTDAEACSFGCAVAAVRIDPETGALALERLVFVDDAGTIVNPLLVDGQLQGGIAQGLGQALLERVAYDETGQLVTGTLADYALPRADDGPEPVLGHTVTPSPRNPLGAKGVGESGCIGTPPAVVNAVLDALAPRGVRDLDMPLTNETIWRALHGAQGDSR